MPDRETAPLRTAVVTGAARGIGRAIAQRLVDEGLHVVVNDVDADELATTAAAIGADAMPGDAASTAGVDALVSQALAHLGTIDLFVANAGITSGAGLDATDDDWARLLEVNVLSQVRAARRLVPHWLEAGHGRLVLTASAAGLLTMLGDLPYSVTKHGSVALAEWLAATYRHRGIVVQAVCPLGVDTRILEEAGPLKDLLTRDGTLAPEDVAESVWQGLQGDAIHVLPHPSVRDYYAGRAADPDAWLGGMNKIQQRLERHQQ
ncbi:SDR family oxidoreductase [Intrasporangium calvum]|uniref:SDR family oxidoreductase n=1 Tax=Intrasporangium calvum TaxID=53358 RepID=A0ABT5GFB9_9MICO|nr:SDR family oxidoreductase [Intrasporangium calvum]MDC5696570.1 SDR family oxidoreductase [Intrasporangium calvum]